MSITSYATMGLQSVFSFILNVDYLICLDVRSFNFVDMLFICNTLTSLNASFMKFLVTFFAVLFSMSICAQEQRKLALVIGNANYEDPNAVLLNPINDSRLMTETFEELEFDSDKINDCNKQLIIEGVLYNLQLFIEDFVFSELHKPIRDILQYRIDVTQVTLNHKLDVQHEENMQLITRAKELLRKHENVFNVAEFLKQEEKIMNLEILD